MKKLKILDLNLYRRKVMLILNFIIFKYTKIVIKK